jgi:hypothetical protein
MRSANAVPVIDVITMKTGWGLDHAPGVVAVLDAFPAEDPNAYVGRVATIRHENGRVVNAEIEAARSHRVTISFFFRGLIPDDVPLGCRLSVES